MSVESNSGISEAVIRRLPKYHRYLTDLELMGEKKVSSAKMSEDLCLNASQIRRDLNCFGGFGQQGYGYNVSKLKDAISKILHIDRQYNVIIIGAGNMGRALMRYPYYKGMGFKVLAAFDSNPALIGTTTSGCEILDISKIEKFCAEHEVDIGIIATPKEAVLDVADLLTKLGIHAIWNFAPVDVYERDGVAVENVHLNDGLYVLCYKMNNL